MNTEGERILAQDPVLAEIVRRLVEAYRPERIYLFGSRARGQVSPDSDYDLLIVVPDDAAPDRRDGGLAYRVLWGGAHRWMPSCAAAAGFTPELI